MQGKQCARQTSSPVCAISYSLQYVHVDRYEPLTPTIPTIPTTSTTVQANRDVYVVDLDKPFHDLIKAAYKGTMPRVPPRVTTRTGIFGAQFPCSHDGEHFGMQSSFRGRLPSIVREDSDGLNAGEANEDGVEGAEGVMGSSFRVQMSEEGAEGFGAVTRSTLPEASGRADAALHSSDDLFSGFEDFARSDGGVNSDVDGGIGCESRTLSWAMAQPLIGSEPSSFWYGRRVVGSSFGGRDSPESYPAVPDASVPDQSLSHDRDADAALRSPGPQSLFMGFEDFSRPAASEALEAARPSQGEAASACTERDVALAAAARALSAADMGSTVAEAAEQPTDFPRPSLVPSRKKILFRSSSRERELRVDVTETEAVREAAGSSAGARPSPQEIEMSQCNVGKGVPQSLFSGVEDYARRVSNDDGSDQPFMRRSGSPPAVRFFLRAPSSAPRGSEMGRGERDGRPKSDELDGSSSYRPGPIRRSMDLNHLPRSRRPEAHTTRGVCGREYMLARLCLCVLSAGGQMCKCGCGHMEARAQRHLSYTCCACAREICERTDAARTHEQERRESGSKHGWVGSCPFPSSRRPHT